MYFNVPRGYDLLLPFLESDAELRRNFFRDLQVVFYAAAALPQNLWDRLVRLARQEKGEAEFAMLGLGLDRDLAARHLGAFPDGAPRRDRPAGGGLRACSCSPAASSKSGCAAPT